MLLLGAGASVKSGVPLAGDLVTMAGIWGYCQHHARRFGDPTLTRSDWWPWLSAQSWFDETAPLPSQYPRAVERLLHPRESRRQFFFHVLSRAPVPSVGYRALAQLVGAGAIRHVLTVNFDDLASRACKADSGVLHVEVIEAPSDLVKFSLSPMYPQIVHLHGAVARYDDRNLEEETQELDPKMRDAVLPLLRDHPLVVLGYRGAEPSIMRDLLLRGAGQLNAFRHGVFWCLLRGEQPTDEVLELADRLGTNFRFIEIVGFDEAMTGWTQNLRPAPAPHVTSEASEPDVPDLRPVRELSLARLDRPTVTSRLIEYSDRMGLVRVDSTDEDAILSRFEAMRLTRLEAGVPVLTRAAALLFGRDDLARVEVRARDGEVFVPIAGNIFRVLERVLEALDDLNEPYRLKAPTSEDVRRFDRRAVKEVVVNALAHRDHDRDEPVRICVTSRELTVVSPGGVVAGLRIELLGERGERAYRNPVLADVLYGCGAMDKRGSGLADARRWTKQAGGDATFGPTTDGDGFVASLTARDLDPDPITGTADPGEIEHFMSNALPVAVNGSVYVAPSAITSRREIYDAHPNVAVPAFAFTPGQLATFSAPSADGSLFAAHVVGEPAIHDAKALVSSVEGQRLLTQLLNSAVLTWAKRRELCSDASSRRLWFPRSDDGALEVTYRGRVREATRTVTKPNVSPATGVVRYWEHEALRFAFRRLGDAWVLQLVPTIVFTTDGRSTLLRGPKVGPLATRRMAHDYNPQVQNDLYFWRWVFANGASSVCLTDSVQLQATFAARDVIDAPPATGGLAGDDDAPADDIADEVAQIIAEQEHALLTDDDE